MNCVVNRGHAIPDGAFDLVLEPGANLRTGIQEFRDHFGAITSLEEDCLILASALFAVDLATLRGERERIVRSISITVPVTNYHALNGVRTVIEGILHTLSHDNWTLHFQQIDGEPEHSVSWPASSGATLLFSGGLDSLAGAVDLLDEHGPENVLFTSHMTGNTTTRGAQRDLHDYLQTQFTAPIARFAARTGGQTDEEGKFAGGNPEITQRTRSFMFLTIATLAARRSGHSKIVAIAENGQMAIHLPLSSGRIGAFSTHTAHPSFVDSFAGAFSQVLQFAFEIVNPYLYNTKAEVVAKLVKAHPDAISMAVSCWKSSRIACNHCGECIPCLIRRIALETHGFAGHAWQRDLLNEDLKLLAPDDVGKTNLVELGMFARSFRVLPDAELNIKFCELYHVSFDRDKACDMYRRFSNEFSSVISHYPCLAPLV